jgi:hypothetical protein
MGALGESSVDTSSTTQNVGTLDLQLALCFQNLCAASQRVHKSTFLHNFAAAGFHLCYILKVRALLLGTGFD